MDIIKSSKDTDTLAPLLPPLKRTNSDFSFFIGQGDQGESLSPPLPDPPRSDEFDERDESGEGEARRLFDFDDNTWTSHSTFRPPPGLPNSFMPKNNYFPFTSMLNRPLFAGIAAFLQEESILQAKCDTVTLQTPLLLDAAYWKTNICTFLETALRCHGRTVNEFCSKYLDYGCERRRLWLLRQTITENICSFAIYTKDDVKKEVFVHEFVDTHPNKEFASQRFTKQFLSHKITWPENNKK